MTKFTIELDKAEVTSRGVTVAIDAGKLSPEIVRELALHGLKQKVSDAASQAASIAKETGNDVAEVTKELMGKAVDALLNGEWSQRGAGGGGVSEEQLVARQVARAAIKAKFGAKSPEWSKFTGLEPSDQLAKLDEIAEANADAFAEAIAAKLAERRAERERKAKLGKSVEISI